MPADEDPGMVHEAFDFGIRLDGVHRPRIQCRVCFMEWPCLTNRYHALRADLDEARRKFARLTEAGDDLAAAIEDENAARNARDLSAASCRVERALAAYRALTYQE